MLNAQEKEIEEQLEERQWILQKVEAFKIMYIFTLTDNWKASNCTIHIGFRY